MALNYGTYSTLDMLRTAEGTTVQQFGVDRIWDAVQDELDIINAQIDEVLDPFVERVQGLDERMRRWGATAEIEMEQIDQWGTPLAQKEDLPSANLGFPLELYAVATQWTRKWLDRAQTRELARRVDLAIKADRKNVLRKLKTAIFFPTNRTFKDVLVDRIDIPVKALANADSMTGPLGPNGEVFNWATHTHYMASATLTEANVKALIANVMEHYNDNEIIVYIPTGLEDTFRTFTGFRELPDNRLSPPTTQYARGAVDIRQNANRAIGILGAAVIWVKPWMPQSYLVAVNMAAEQRPLVWRTFDAASGAFRIVYQDRNNPLEASVWEREFGIGVGERTVMAVYYVGSASYVTPTF